MAAPPLGKYIGLLVPVLLLLLYTCCYGFRIRDHPASNSVSVEELSSSGRATCDSNAFPRCQQSKPSSFASGHRWHDTAAASSRILAKRKPPVEVTLREGREEGVPVRLERIARSTVGVVDQVEDRDSSEDDDDDDDEAVVEVEDSRELIVDSVGEEQDSNSKDEDDEDRQDEEHEDGKKWKSKLPIKRNKSREDTESRRKETRPFKELKRSKDENEDDDDDDDDEDEDEKIDGRSSRRQERSKIEAEDDDEDEEKADSEDEDEDDDEDEEEEPKVTVPPMKLEKIRYADKDKARSMEVSSSMEKPKEIEKPLEKKEEEKPQKVKAKKPAEPAKKPEAEPSKPKAGPKLETKEKVPPKVSAPKEKVPAKVEDKEKQQVKASAPRAKPKEQQMTQPEKKKESVRPKSTPPAKHAEVKRLDKNDSKDKTKTLADAPFTLAELNDALLRLPTFMPNFTAMEDLECQQHGKIFLRQLRGHKLWALQMLDANAKIPPGMLRGNMNQLGDFDECMGVMAHVKLNNSTIRVQGKYCLADIDFYASHRDMRLPVSLMQALHTLRSTMRDPGHLVPRSTTMNWGVCIPAACSAEAAKSIVEHALSPYNFTTGITFNVGVDPKMCYTKQKPESFSKETIGVMYFYAMFVCLALVATTRDYLGASEGKGNYSERIIMAFSVKRTLKSLFKKGTSSFDISCIHGLRAIGAIMIYIGHKFMPLLGLPYSNRMDIAEVITNPISVVARVCFIYTEWFLLFSGVLTAYNMAHEYSKRGEIRWVCRLVTRYVRLTPVLLVVVFYYAFVMEHTGIGPNWNNIIMRNVDLCKSTGWMNLLYMQNLFNFEDMCATHTHQLAVDMQLSLLAPILVFFLQFKAIIGILMICFFILLAATLRYIRMVTYNLSLIFFHGVSVRQLYKTANLTYILPVHRLTSYVLGVGLGVLLHHTKRDLKMNKVVVIFGWLVATALTLWTIFSPWNQSKKDYTYDAEEAASYGVISPNLASIALCWIIFACHTNHGGVMNKMLTNQWLLVISRLSYALYMTQFAVFFHNMGTTRYSNEFTIVKALDIAEVSCAVIVAIVVTLLFDIPMQEVKNVITECTDTRPIAKTPIEDKPSDTSEKKEDKDKDQPDDNQKEDIVIGGRETSEATADEPQEDAPIPKRLTRRKSFVFYDSDGELPADIGKDSGKRYSDDEHRQRRRSKSNQRDYSDSEPEEEKRARFEREEAVLRGRRSTSKTRDKRLRSSDEEEQHLLRREREEPRHYRRSESRGRSAIRDVDDHRPSEPVSRDRSSSRGPEYRRLPSRSEEPESVQRQTRSFSRSSDPRRVYSSGSEEEHSQRRKLERRQLPGESRVSDEEDWESELRMRRKQFMEKLATQEKDSALEEEDLALLRRRSSAEGKMALLKDPSADDNMDSWTVSLGSRVAQLGSSQEPSEPEDDSAYRKRREYREQAPPPREDTQSEEETIWDASKRSYTSSSQITSMEEDEDDLSKLSQEEADLSESGWNIVKESGDPQPKGLYKRESIIKSQASEEDPEYLLPERPKLVQQEREHPFKKAWQMQKSRSEEDSYAIKESKDQARSESRSKNEKATLNRERSGEQSSEYEDVSSYTDEIGAYADDESESVTLSRSRSTDIEENRTSSKSEETASTDGRSRESSKANSRSDAEEDSSKLSWPAEEEQFGRRTVRSKSEETDWTWEEEET